MCNVRNRCYNDNISCMILRAHCIALESITCHCMATTLGQTLTDRHSIQTKQCPPPSSPRFFTGRMPFLPPNQQCQSTEGNILTYTDSVKELRLECGPMPNVMVALPNIGGALCSTPQSLADAHYSNAVQ